MRGLLTEKTCYFASKEYSEIAIERSLVRLLRMTQMGKDVPLEIIKNEMSILEKKIMWDRSF